MGNAINRVLEWETWLRACRLQDARAFMILLPVAVGRRGGAPASFPALSPDNPIIECSRLLTRGNVRARVRAGEATTTPSTGRAGGGSDHEGKRLSRVGKQQMSVSVPRIVPSTTLPSFLTLLLSIPTQGTARAHSWHLLMLLLFGCSPSSPLSHLHLHLHWQLHSHLHFAFNFALCRSCGGTCAGRWLSLAPSVLGLLRTRSVCLDLDLDLDLAHDETVSFSSSSRLNSGPGPAPDVKNHFDFPSILFFFFFFLVLLRWSRHVGCASRFRMS